MPSKAFERRVISTLEGLTKRLDTIIGEPAELAPECAAIASMPTSLTAANPSPTVPHNLRAWVEANALTHNQAAARISITPSAVGHYINGHHMPPAPTRKRIAKVTGIPPEPAPGSLPFEVEG